MLDKTALQFMNTMCWKPLFLGSLLMAAVRPAAAEVAPLARADELLQMSLEQLLDVEVVSASKYGQSASEAPASVSVVTADDIRTFGYRTLADALSSVRGFYITSDHIYKFAGVRGFSPPGDFNDRLLVMVDGHRINENIFDTGFLGTDFPVDMDLVERIEVIRGPGSSLYGSNALLGVINVITKKGEALGGTEGALAAGRDKLDKERLSWGRKLDNGADVLLSTSKMRTPGAEVSFPDAGLSNGGRTSGTDFDHNASAFGKFSLDGLSVEAAWSRRDKGNAAALTGTVFNDPASFYRDEMAFVDTRYRSRLSDSVEAEGRVFVGSYDYTGNFLYAPADGGLNLDMASGRWWGGEFKLLKDMGPHRLTLGLEVQDNWRQQQTNHFVNSTDLLVNEAHSSRRSGLYAQDDYRFSEALSFSAGLRHDTNTGADALTSPRLAAVWRASPTSVVKLLYGSAFRVPNNYELFYAFPSQQAANPALRPERIHTWESTLDHYLNPDLRLSLAAYVYQMHDQIAQVAVPDPANPQNNLLQYQNQGDITGRGFEAEAEKQFGNGGRLRGSLGWERVTDVTSQVLQNAPRRLAKLNFSWPVAFGWRLGLEGQAISERNTTSVNATGRVPGYGLVNLTLLRPMAADGWEVSASIRNLFDRQVMDPAGSDVAFPDRNALPGDRLDWRLKVVRRF